MDYNSVYRAMWKGTEDERLIGPRKKIVLSLFPFNDEENIDVGCGTGEFISLLISKGVNVQGIDFSEYAIQIAEKKNLNVSITDCTNTNFQSQQFKVITAIDVLEHIKNDNKAIDEWYRILKKNGFLIISVPHNMRLWRKDDEQVGHYRRYLLHDLKILLGSRFTIEEVRYSGFPFYMILREIRYSFNKNKNLTTGCFTKSIGNKNSIFRKFSNTLIKLEIFFSRIPIGTSIIIRAKKL